MNAILVIVFIVLGLLLYFAPSIVAKERKHPNATAIFVLNLFLGWSVIGWVGAIVWSYTNSSSKKPEEGVVVDYVHAKKPSRWDIPLPAWLAKYTHTQRMILAGVGVIVFLILIGWVSVAFDKPKVETPKTAEQIQAQQKAQAAAEAQAKTEQAAFDKTKAGQICKKHPDWTHNDCQGVANNKIWLGMSIDMLKAERGLPSSANPSNYGSGNSWQWCWFDHTPSCFYGKDDGIVTSYN
jgi:hypothetical protein